MRSDVQEVRDVLAALAALAPKIEGCREELDAQEVGNALYGLQNMRIDVREVRDVLAALAPKIKGCREELRAQEVGNALYGLQGMSSDVREVVEVLAAVTLKIEKCDQRFASTRYRETHHMVCRAWTTVWNRSMLCSELWSVNSSSLMARCPHSTLLKRYRDFATEYRLQRRTSVSLWVRRSLYSVRAILKRRSCILQA
jgi:hypothetical protein